MGEWLEFRHEEGWGTDEFEDNIPDGYEFPETWESIDDRYDAREILNVQFERLEWAKGLRQEVLENALQFGGFTAERKNGGDVAFSVRVNNATDGHGVPTGFDAERLMFLEITVTDADGNVVFVSGDRDPNGDVRDTHSLYVHNHELPEDPYLFNLQSKIHGSDEPWCRARASFADQPISGPNPVRAARDESDSDLWPATRGAQAQADD